MKLLPLCLLAGFAVVVTVAEPDAQPDESPQFDLEKRVAKEDGETREGKSWSNRWGNNRWNNYNNRYNDGRWGNNYGPVNGYGQWNGNSRYWNGQNRHWNNRNGVWNGNNRYWNGNNRYWNGNNRYWNGNNRWNAQRFGNGYGNRWNPWNSKRGGGYNNWCNHGFRQHCPPGVRGHIGYPGYNQHSLGANGYDNRFNPNYYANRPYSDGNIANYADAFDYAF